MNPAFRYSIASLFGLTLLCATALALATKPRAPRQNQLMVRVDNAWQIYDVEDAAYGIHREGDTWFLTVACSTSSDPTLDPPDCKLEFSIPFEDDPKPIIKRNVKFNVPIYDEQLGNLNYFYYLGFGDIDHGIFVILAVNGWTIDGTLEANDGNLLLRADFFNRGVTRSFD